MGHVDDSNSHLRTVQTREKQFKPNGLFSSGVAMMIGAGREKAR